MNKSPNELFVEVDRQLGELEAENSDRRSSSMAREEVDCEVAAKFNRVRADRAAHPVRNALVSIVMLLFVAASIYMMVRAPRPTGSYRVVTGTVQSSAIVWSGRTHWGSVAEEKVVLPDGRIVGIRSDAGC